MRHTLDNGFHGFPSRQKAYDGDYIVCAIPMLASTVVLMVATASEYDYRNPWFALLNALASRSLKANQIVDFQKSILKVAQT